MLIHRLMLIVSVTVTRKRRSFAARVFSVLLAFYYAGELHAQHLNPVNAEKARSKPSAGAFGADSASFSATYFNWHDPSDQELISAHVEFSSRGLRVRELGPHAAQEMLQDFVGERVWLINHDKSTSHLLPLVKIEGLEDTSVLVGASFMSPEPCGNLIAENQGEGKWRGRRVTAFDCLDDANEVLAIEFLDSLYKIVVYRRTVDGFVHELRGMTERTFSESHFTPPDEYRAVGKEEFFFGAPALLPYTSPQEQ